MKTINYTDYSPFSMLQLQDELARNSETFIRERDKDREAAILNYLDNINFHIQKAWMNEQNGLVLKVNESLYDTHKLKSELESLERERLAVRPKAEAAVRAEIEEKIANSIHVDIYEKSLRDAEESLARQDTIQFIYHTDRMKENENAKKRKQELLR